jgi:hypothetical protein
MVVIDWMRMGLLPPMGTSPILTSTVFLRLYCTMLLQYCLNEAMDEFTKNILVAKLTVYPLFVSPLPVISCADGD